MKRIRCCWLIKGVTRHIPRYASHSIESVSDDTIIGDAREEHKSS